MNAYKFNNKRTEQMKALVSYRKKIGVALDQLKNQLDFWDQKISSNDNKSIFF